MASRLRAPVGSKLVRPPPTGSGLKGPNPAGVPLTRPQAAKPHLGQQEVFGTRSAAAVNQRRPQGKQVASVKSTPVVQSKSDPTPPPSAPVSLEIGDQVLCAGGKTGVVAFVGPTQFAKGVWAGVILDTSEGKNNGSVNGVQYFRCDPNRGLFARPEKLTLVAKAAEIHAAAVKSVPQQTQPLTFSVGDRVLLGDGKEGVVAFYGNTEFARGVWVGVVLDVPEGKNDGVVAGIQYFECEPNHGIFTRPQKLSLLRSQQVVNGSLHVLPHQRSAQSTPIDREGLKALREKLKIGDRVLVAGLKEGILRFLGPTEFAKGVWAGIELEEPLGKNDGAVSGKRLEIV